MERAAAICGAPDREPCSSWAKNVTVVVGSRPDVPVEGMERVLEGQVFWVNAATPTKWSGNIGLPVPEVFVQSGWGYGDQWNPLGREVRKFAEAG